MRQWRDCATTQERHAAVIEALRLAQGKVNRAAKLLGLSRQYLHGVLKIMRAQGDTVASVAMHDTVKRNDTSARVGRVAKAGTVVPSDSKSLTSGDPAPTVPAMDSVADQTDVETEWVAVTVQLPKPLKERLEREALEEKQKTGGRFALSPIVVRYIKKGMAEPAGAPATPKRRGRSQKGGAE